MQAKMAKFINWSNLSEDDLYSIKRTAEDEISRRHREKQENEKTKGLSILRKMYPSIDEHVKLSDCNIREQDITVVFTPNIEIKNVDDPPYLLRLEKFPSDREIYDLHFDLHR